MLQSKPNYYIVKPCNSRNYLFILALMFFSAAGFAQPVITTDPVTEGMIDEEYKYKIRTAGWSVIPPQILITDGELPEGLKFKDDGNGRAEIKGDPEEAGVFPIVLTVRRIYNYNDYSTQSFTITVYKKEGTIKLEELITTYNGSPYQPKVKTSPNNLDYKMSYNGSTNTPVNAGTYNVVAEIDDPEYQGTVSDVLVIRKASANISLGGNSVVYNGNSQSIGYTTSPAGLNASIKYNGSNSIPVDAGTYSVSASIEENNYEGSTSGTFVIQQKEAVVSLSAMTAVFDGSAKEASVATTPQGLNVRVTYNGSVSPPVDAGSYAVEATVEEKNYFGSASGTLVISETGGNDGGDNGGGDNGGGDNGGGTDGNGDSDGGSDNPAGRPVITNLESTPLFYRQRDEGMPISQTLIINDFDDVEMDSAMIWISSGYTTGEDMLVYENDDNDKIVGEFDAANGILKLIGTDTKSNYEIALSSVRYSNNILGETFNIKKEVTLTVNDGTFDSAPVTRDINIFVLPELDIVNAFTPNGDNVNDYWNFVNLERYSAVSISVFNKSGIEVYKCSGRDCNWDGSYNGKLLPAGIYFYVIDLDEGKRKYRGTVALLR